MEKGRKLNVSNNLHFSVVFFKKNYFKKEFFYFITLHCIVILQFIINSFRHTKHNEHSLHDSLFNTVKQMGIEVPMKSHIKLTPSSSQRFLPWIWYYLDTGFCTIMMYISIGNIYYRFAWHKYIIHIYLQFAFFT